MPQKQLIQNLEVKHPRFTETWELTSLNLDKTEIAAEFAAREQYLSTDYADIGDDHTDPFLTQMVNLGFIEGVRVAFIMTKAMPYKVSIATIITVTHTNLISKK